VTVTPTFSVCPSHGYVIGEHNFCPKCDEVAILKSAGSISCVKDLAVEDRQPCEVWTRVMGYHRPMSQFNLGKKGEFMERTYFTEKDDGKISREEEFIKTKEGLIDC
ncbi:MAG: anaerobic ribonucleoside-triphosphate reductase, partial [bacterium]